jgi:hypothetical protein
MVATPLEEKKEQTVGSSAASAEVSSTPGMPRGRDTACASNLTPFRGVYYIEPAQTQHVLPVPFGAASEDSQIGGSKGEPGLKFCLDLLLIGETMAGSFCSSMMIWYRLIPELS